MLQSVVIAETHSRDSVEIYHIVSTAKFHMKHCQLNVQNLSCYHKNYFIPTCIENLATEHYVHNYFHLCIRVLPGTKL